MAADAESHSRDMQPFVVSGAANGVFFFCFVFFLSLRLPLLLKKQNPDSA